MTLYERETLAVETCPLPHRWHTLHLGNEHFPRAHIRCSGLSRNETTQLITIRYIPNWRSFMAQHTHRVHLTILAC